MLRYISRTFFRELKIMFSRPIYLYGTVLVLVFCAAFLFSLLGEGQPKRIPIGYVDHDESYISHSMYNQINALEGVEIINKYASYHDARDAMQKGKIYGFIVVEKDTYTKAVNGERPTISYYYNEAYMVPGTFAYKSFMTIATVINSGINRTFLRARGVAEIEIMPSVQPITTIIHGIGNPWTSYAIYLISMLWPGILALCIVVMTVFTIGFELKTKTSREWLKEGGNSIVNALIGKLLPYFIIYFIMGVSFETLAYRIVGYPLLGPFWVMILTITLLIAASFGVGIFLIGLFPVLRDALSAASLYSILAVSMSGMTVPIESMIGPMQGFAQIFPLRQYYLIYVKWGVLGGSFSECWINMIGLLIFCLLPFMVLGRLNSALVKQNYPTK